MARTLATPTGYDYGNRSPGLPCDWTVALTADAATTGVAFVFGYALGKIVNTSGGALTITLRGAATQDGTALTMYDKDGSPIAALTVPNNSEHEIPSEALAGAKYLVLVLSAGTANATLRLMR